MTIQRKFDEGDGMKPSPRGRDLLGANSEIGRKLRQYYDDITSEPVPERFVELLSQLEEAERTQDTKKPKKE